jgi:hypothetical protein
VRGIEEEPEDLIGHDEESIEDTEEPSLYFRWNRSFKKYVMVRVTPMGVIHKIPEKDYQNTG